jgi:hypothetical protein
MYFSEKAFIMSFIARLSQEGVETIMLNDAKYYCGIEKMHQYFQENRERIGNYADELAMLFLKDSSGEYRQFDTAIENLNAGMLSFDNPYYVMAHIKVSDSDAEEVLKENSEYISKPHIHELVNAFRAAS